MIRYAISLFWSMLWPLVFVVVLWAIWITDFTYELNWTDYGVRPRNVAGLIGILTSPFLHGSAGHLFSNTVPFLVASTFIFFLFPKEKWKILLLIWFFSGFGVWMIGHWNSNHIGASGVVYGLVAFLLTSGIIRKNRMMAAISLILIFAYGSMVWGLFPQWQFNSFIRISWESHLSGAIIGVILAYTYRKHGPPDDQYFVDEEDNDDEDADENQYWKVDPFYDNEVIKKEDVTIKYHYKDKDNDKTT